MMELARGIAHVSFSGGGIFLPIRDPYDRQTLVDHVMQRVRTKGHVQVLIGNRRWIVRLSPALRGTCGRCGQSLNAACYSTTENGCAHCVECALGAPLPAQRPQPEEWRQAG